MYDGVFQSSSEVCDFVDNLLAELAEVKGLSKVRPDGSFALANPGPGVWVPPPLGFLKMNVDAACFEDLNGGGVGTVIRDHWGHIKLVILVYVEPLAEVAAMEALAILHVCVIAGEEGFADLIVETDSEVVVKGITSSGLEFASFDHIIDAIQVLDPLMSPNSVLFTPRMGNGMAHSLARYAKTHRSQFISSEFFPPCIHSLMCTEVFSEDL